MNSQDLDTALKMAFKASYVSAIDAAYMLARKRQDSSASLMPALVANMLALVQENLDTTAPPPMSVSVGGGLMRMKSSIGPEKITGTKFKELFDSTGQESCLWMAIPSIRVVDAAFILCNRPPPDGVEISELTRDALIFKMINHIHKQLNATPNLATITQHQFRTLAAGLDVNIESVVGTKPAAPDKQDDTTGGIDFTMVATRKQLIDAFGKWGMQAAWFDDLNSRQWLLDARRKKGQGQKGHVIEPLFCPFAVMNGLIEKVRKAKRLQPETAWRTLEHKFPKVHATFEIHDPRDQTGD